VYLVAFTPYIVIISFTNCYIHIFSSSAASVFNKFGSVQFTVDAIVYCYLFKYLISRLTKQHSAVIMLLTNLIVCRDNEVM